MSPPRYRDAHSIQNHFSGRSLIYDLERTFVYSIPDEFGHQLKSWPRADDIAVAPRQWLIDADLITNKKKPVWADANSDCNPAVTDISLDLSGACNMGCQYCFENPINSRVGRMSDQVLSQTLDFAVNQAEKSGSLSLHFGSGEPLLSFAKLKLLTEQALERADERNIALGFELTTNATLVTPEIAKFLARYHFNVRVSFDGPKEIHDRFRPMINGRGSYARVEQGLSYLLEKMPERTTVNSVICSDTRLVDIWNWARDLGIEQLHAIKVGATDDDDNRLKQIEVEDYKRDLRTICREMLTNLKREEKPVNFQPVTKVVRRLMIPEPITRFCGVAGTYLGISATGSIYPCFRHLGLDEYLLGDVFGNIDETKRSEFRRHEAADVDSRAQCKDCWARYLCGGGCYADSTVYAKDKLSPSGGHCPFWLAEIETGIEFYEYLRSLNPLHCLALFNRDGGNSIDRVIDSAPSFLTRAKTF